MSNANQPTTREEWFVLVDEQTTSGLTQTEFCKQRNLKPCRFSYYKQLHSPSQPKGTFSPVKVNHELSVENGNIKIDLPNGFCCHVPSNISADKLKILIGALVLC